VHGAFLSKEARCLDRSGTDHRAGRVPGDRRFAQRRRR